MRLDDQGRCCGRKPLVYKKHRGDMHPRGRFCPRCDRCFNMVDGEQIENWAWMLDGDEWVRRVRDLPPRNPLPEEML